MQMNVNKEDYVLSVDSLSAGYGKKTIVKPTSFDIKRAEVYGLIGLNGAGKTTLIKTVLGLREKFSGNINLDGKENISFLPERFDPPWFLTGYDFIAFSLSLYKKKLTKEQARDAVARVSLNPDFLDKRVSTYSKGMRQKLGLLATFLTGAPILVLDEPMSGLDPRARQEVKQLVLDTKKEGRSIFMSSHILSDVEALCDRVSVFHDQSIIFTGTPQELKEKGASEDIEKAFLALL
jgi:ABC-2 type transport system ATP-binding protein